MSPKFNTQAKKFENESELESMRNVLKDTETQIQSIEIEMAKLRYTLEILNTRKQNQLQKLIKFQNTFNLLAGQKQILFDTIKNLQQENNNGVVLLSEVFDICKENGMSISEIEHMLDRFEESNYVIYLSETTIQLLKKRLSTKMKTTL